MTVFSEVSLDSEEEIDLESRGIEFESERGGMESRDSDNMFLQFQNFGASGHIAVIRSE
jgi:hypothetical protein